MFILTSHVSQETVACLILNNLKKLYLIFIILAHTMLKVIASKCMHDAWRISGDTACKSWQQKWNEENTGRYTYYLILKVGTKVIFPQERDI